jgi:serine/threonine protein kinase
MGTAGYMSPEQVRSADTDHRSDIFSFGAILYELLAGKRAFQGETSVDTMQAILRQEAPELPEMVPAGLRQIVAHCLEKDRADRFQSARDLRLALSSISQSGSHPSLTPVRSLRQNWILPSAVALALVAGLAAGKLLLRDAGGEARAVSTGDAVAMEASGHSLIVARRDSSHVRMFHVPVDGSAEREIPSVR